MKFSHIKSLFATSAVLGLLFVIAGCAPPPPPEEPVEEVAETDRVWGPTTPETQYSWTGFPQSAQSPGEALILIEREVPGEVRPGDDVNYLIRITNQSTFTVDELVHTEQLSASLDFVGASPFPEERDGDYTWTLNNFGPGQVQEITVDGKSNRTGSMRYSGDTDLSFGLGSLSLIASAIQAELDLAVSNPNVSLIDELIPVNLSFRNSGTALVEDAQLVHTFPEGLLTEDGKSRLELEMGDFNPGEIKTFDTNLRGVATGRYETQLTATAKGGLSASATLSTSVVKPELQITANAPQLRYVGNIIPYQIEISNVGDGVANNTEVRQTLPAGTTLASADQGGIAEGQTVVWNLGTLNPGQTRIVSTRVVGERIMIARSTALADANAADQVRAVMVTDVEGIQALLVEVVDDNDPVPVGELITYLIEVTNTGSLEATGISVDVGLTPEMEFIESEGASKSRLNGSNLQFDVLPSLPPSAKATWTVVVRATGGGDMRLIVNVQSDQLDRPVTEEEASNFYE